MVVTPDYAVRRIWNVLNGKVESAERIRSPVKESGCQTVVLAEC